MSKKRGTDYNLLIKSLMQSDEERHIVEKIARDENPTADEARHLADALNRASGKAIAARIAGNFPRQHSADATVQIVKTFTTTNLVWREKQRAYPKKGHELVHGTPEQKKARWDEYQRLLDEKSAQYPRLSYSVLCARVAHDKGCSAKTVARHTKHPRRTKK